MYVEASEVERGRDVIQFYRRNNKMALLGKAYFILEVGIDKKIKY